MGRERFFFFFVYSDSDVMHLGAVVQMGREGNHLYLKTFVPELFALSHHHRPCYVDIPKWYILLLIVFLPKKGRCKRRRESLKKCDNIVLILRLPPTVSALTNDIAIS